MRRELWRRAAGDHAELKSAWRALVARIGKGERAAAMVGQPPSRVSEYGSVDSERSPSIAAVLELESDVGAPVVTEALAALHGFRLVPIEAGEAAPLGPLVARVGAEIGQALHAYADAAADGAYSPAERRKLGKEFRDVQREVAALLAALRGGNG